MNSAVVELFDGVDDLIRRVAHTECPETRKVRARVHAALVAARKAFDNVVKTAPTPSPSQPLPVAAATEDDTHPLDGTTTQALDGTVTQALGVALLLGLGLGLMVDS
ncbi:MAG TPA: hypothetical protein VNH21_08340 [Steroidobacteraceae bacterium]|nr:hypothetical protein [Steroidobacteraceae bacterium]